MPFPSDAPTGSTKPVSEAWEASFRVNHAMRHDGVWQVAQGQTEQQIIGGTEQVVDMRRVTIKDVAREAGVSISTVSNALNDVDVLSPNTKAQILAVAKRLNYFPNPHGQGLRVKESKAIGLFVSELTGSYYGILADTMHWACQNHGYELYIYITNRNETILNNILGQRVDGAVILYEGIEDATLERLRESGRPVVFLDRPVEEPHLASVVFDSLRDGEMATEYLISLGHRDLMFVSGLKDNFDSIHRQEGFLQAIKRHGITLRPENTLHGLFEQEESYREVTRYLQAGHALPDAIFAANDLSAIGCFKALRDAGLRVPEDVSLIGCDDIELCDLLDPPMTTIHTNFQLQGELAIEKLMRMIHAEETGSIHKIEGRLIVRKSCRVRTARK